MLFSPYLKIQKLLQNSGLVILLRKKNLLSGIYYCLSALFFEFLEFSVLFLLLFIALVF